MGLQRGLFFSRRHRIQLSGILIPRFMRITRLGNPIGATALRNLYISSCSTTANVNGSNC